MEATTVTAGGPPESVPSSRGWGGFRATDRAIVLEQVTSLLTAGASLLAPAEVLTAVCEAAASHLSLVNVVLFKRIAGQSRVLTWSAPGVSPASLMAAREHVWSSAADLVEGGALHDGAGDSDLTATASTWDERLGLSAMLHVESRRKLDRHDRALLDELLRRMLGVPDHGS